jgi:predicted peptidase
MLPSLCRNNQEHTRDIALLHDVRFSQQCCWEFKSSVMWRAVGWVVQVILQGCSAFIFKGHIEQEKLNLLWVPNTCDTSRHWEPLVWRHSITTRGHKNQISLLIQQKGVTTKSEKNEDVTKLAPKRNRTRYVEQSYHRYVVPQSMVHCSHWM